ncbi:hypothetical protein FIBSPDRAFT_739725, partial [Athelia psychrophila]
PPLWLRDEKVRAGIRHLHEYDRAVEEEARVKKERISLQQSARREWATLTCVLASNSKSLPHHTYTRVNNCFR